MATPHIGAVAHPWMVDVSGGVYQTFLQQQDTELRARSQLMEEVEELRGRVDRRNQEIQELLDEKRTLRERVHTYREQINVLSTERDAAQQQLQSEIKGRENLQQKCHQNLIDTKKLEISFKSRESEVVALKKSLQEEKQLCSKLQLSIDACVSDALAKQSSVVTEQANQKCAQLENQLFQLRATLASSSNHAAQQERERQLTSLRHQVFHLTQERDASLRNVHTHLLPKLSEAERVINDLKTQAQRSNAVSREADNKKTEMAAELAESRRDVQYWKSKAELLTNADRDSNRWKAEAEILKLEVSHLKEVHYQAEESWKQQAFQQNQNVCRTTDSSTRTHLQPSLGSANNNNMDLHLRGGKKRRRQQAQHQPVQPLQKHTVSQVNARTSAGQLSNPTPLLSYPTPLLMSTTPLLMGTTPLLQSQRPVLLDTPRHNYRTDTSRSVMCKIKSEL